jgi:hypothetical protein
LTHREKPVANFALPHPTCTGYITGNGLVIKIVPMGGDALINGEPQMGPEQVRSEAAIAQRLTALRPDVQAAKVGLYKLTS